MAAAFVREEAHGVDGGVAGAVAVAWFGEPEPSEETGTGKEHGTDTQPGADTEHAGAGTAAGTEAGTGTEAGSGRSAAGPSAHSLAASPKR